MCQVGDTFPCRWVWGTDFVLCVRKLNLKGVQKRRTALHRRLWCLPPPPPPCTLLLSVMHAFLCALSVGVLQREPTLRFLASKMVGDVEQRSVDPCAVTGTQPYGGLLARLSSPRALPSAMPVCPHVVCLVQGFGSKARAEDKVSFPWGFDKLKGFAWEEISRRFLPGPAVQNI